MGKYLIAALIGFSLVFVGELGSNDDALAIPSRSIGGLPKEQELRSRISREKVLKLSGICNADFVRARLNGLLVALEDDAFVINEWLFNSLSSKEKLGLVKTINCFVMGPPEAGASTLSKVVLVSSGSRERIATWSPAGGLRLARY